MKQFDISVVIIFHHEGLYSIPALASMQALIHAAKNHGLHIEACAILDTVDDLTRACVKDHGNFLNCINEVSYNDFDISRNMAAQSTHGEYLACLDGGDLWGNDWLHLAHAAATAYTPEKDVIWHPESLFYFYEGDLSKQRLSQDIPHPHARAYHFLQSSTNTAKFDRRSLLFHHIWTGNVFAKRSLYLQFPYTTIEHKQSHRMADWLWNISTTWDDIPHLVVLDTVHIIRIKNTESSWEGRFIGKQLLPKIPQYPLEHTHQTTSTYTKQSSVDFIALISQYFNPIAYSTAYPDAKASGLEPLEHFLTHGILRQQDNFSNILITAEEACMPYLDNDEWQYFDWCKRTVAVKVSKPLKQSLLNQILQQAEHERAIIATGYYTIKNLPCIDSNDFFIRHQINIDFVDALLRQQPIKWLIIQDNITFTGSQKYLNTIIDTINDLHEGPVSFCITKKNIKHMQIKDWDKYNILSSLKNTNILFLSNICGSDDAYITKFAHILNIIRPHCILMHTSLSGFILTTFGKFLSTFSKIYCFYFGFVPLHINPHSIEILARKDIVYAKIITDNIMALQKMSKLLGHKSIHQLNLKFVFPENNIFEKRLHQRYTTTRQKIKHTRGRWVWIGRVEDPIKGFDILQEIAKLRPDDRFDIFGPIQESISHISNNMHYIDIIQDISLANFELYDGFLLTSLSEGMPNIVLEMSAHAIPMVISDVGGLRNTFDDHAVKFVRQHQNKYLTAASFMDALDDILNLPTNKAIDMVNKAAKQVQKKHAPEIYMKNFCELFNIIPKKITL